MDNLVPENEQFFYAVKVNNTIVGNKQFTPQLAQEQISLLDEQHQLIAEVVQVTKDGKEVLFG